MIRVKGQRIREFDTEDQVLFSYIFMLGGYKTVYLFDYYMAVKKSRHSLYGLPDLPPLSFWVVDQN